MTAQTVVIQEFPRPSREQMERLSQFGVATVHEALGRTGLMNPGMRPIYSGAKIAGSALTVLGHPGDNTMLHVAATVCRPGDIIVVALSSECTDGMLGDLLATSFRANGAIGVVIDAGCRDVATLTAMRFPVWAKAISAKGTAKGNLGSVNTPVVCAGALVHAGDAIVADDDGVVVVPHSQLDECIAASAAREKKEADVRARLARGEFGLDIYGLRDKLARAGLVFQNAAEKQEQS
ncbi:MAG TPA: 4-carboxy-4-hydroxy-2-oxoadipate aldolase/oxaloacetate decarboxylase [Bryobacteraceae bacterium]|jgi:4-hydroxy-4-methyl-2-oxoglutarate aldolase|nr:4-carboxy-4-hydroxy-2-oxoadipate aldolase/oxaloacetate decarboxylase [Bryobacteraceae bacterium]